MRISKKGFAMQFNWLFVLIAGVVILGFFFSLITERTVKQDEEEKTKSTQELEELLRVSSAADQTQKTMLFDKKVTFQSSYDADTDTSYSAYSVEGSPYNARYDYQTIFSPPVLDGQRLIILNKDFNTGFRIISLTYITNQDVEYVFLINDLEAQSLLSLIYNSMPGNTTKNIISGSITGYPDKNYDKTIFVMQETDKGTSDVLGTLLNFNTGFNTDKASALIISSGDSLTQGEIRFYEYNALQEQFEYQRKSVFLDLPTVLGAVISGNNQIYECNLKKVFARTSLLSRLYQGRMSMYAKQAPDTCKEYYEEAEEYMKKLEGIQEKSTDTINNFKPALVAINNLKSLNNYLMTKTDCPLIY